MEMKVPLTQNVGMLESRRPNVQPMMNGKSSTSVNCMPGAGFPAEQNRCNPSALIDLGESQMRSFMDQIKPVSSSIRFFYFECLFLTSRLASH